MSTWQPIATAPKDGTLVVVRWADKDWPPLVAYFCDRGWCDARDGYEITEPSYWAPIPKGPE